MFSKLYGECPGCLLEKPTFHRFGVDSSNISGFTSSPVRGPRLDHPSDGTQTQGNRLSPFFPHHHDSWGLRGFHKKLALWLLYPLIHWQYQLPDVASSHPPGRQSPRSRPSPRVITSAQTTCVKTRPLTTTSLRGERGQ